MTVEKDPDVLEPSPSILAQGVKCQRLGESGWNRIRYAEAEKVLKRGAVFQPLTMNGQFRPPVTDSSLRQLERTLGTITHGLLIQRQAFIEGVNRVRALCPEAGPAIQDHLVDVQTDFRGKSDALLQFVCGKRAEVLAERRKAVEPADPSRKRSLQAIPPSSSHLFDEDQLGRWISQPGQVLGHYSARKRPLSTPHHPQVKAVLDQKPSLAPSAVPLSPSLVGIEPNLIVPNDVLGGVTKGGQLANFVENWLSLGAGPQLVKIITGYRIPFSLKPSLMRLHPPFPPQLSTVSSPNMNIVIQSLLSQRMITLASETSGFLCPMFLVDKGNGSMRPVFNLKRLNAFVCTKQFRLVNHAKIPSFLQRNDFMASIDLFQAYCHIPVHQSHQRFLCFVHEGRVYKWTSLPFGLASAPQAFAQLSNWVVSILRKNGIRTLVYLDDFLFAAQDPLLLQMQIDWTLNLLAHLGWVVNREKSVLIPTQKIDYLGISWDTQLHRISLPLNKVSLLGQRLQKFIRSPFWSLKSAQSRDSDSQSSPTSSIPSSSSSHSLSSPVRVKMVHLQSGELCSPSAIARTFMSTDASDEGWGAVLENVSIQGTWTQKQRSWHISWQPEGVVCGSEGDSILPQSGGEPLVSSSVGQQDCCGLHSQTGGATLSHSPERNKEVTVSDIHAEHSYNPPLHTGKVQLSRRRSLSAGSSPRLACSSTADQVSVPSLGSAGDRPVCDLSIESRPALCVVGSSRQTGDLHRRVLQGLEGLELAWVFPPPPLLPQVLHHLNRASGLFIVVAPRWQKTFWRADLKTRAIAPPFVVQDPRSRVMDLSTGLPPPLAENLMLEIWLIRGGINKLRGGRKLKNVC
ncbi:hypothetical protein WDU94_010815 [Cyamophila willieti]